MACFAAAPCECRERGNFLRKRTVAGAWRDAGGISAPGQPRQLWLNAGIQRTLRTGCPGPWV